MKPRSWRRYWWYRPPSLSWTRSTAEVRQIADTYTTWLAQSRGWSIETAMAYIEGQRVSTEMVAVVERPLFGEAA